MISRKCQRVASRPFAAKLRADEFTTVLGRQVLPATLNFGASTQILSSKSSITENYRLMFMELKPIERTDRGTARLNAALSIYRDTILPAAVHHIH
jgi:hypothetical protein